MDAKDDFHKMFDDELRAASVLAFANTSPPFTATRSGKKLTSRQKDADGAGNDSVMICSKAQSPTSGAGLGQADMGCGSGRVFGKIASGGAFVPPAQ